MRIRSITELDAEAYRRLYRQLDAETPFRLYEEGERTGDMADYEAEIKRFITTLQSNIFVAEEEETGVLVGYLQAIGRTPRRVRHVVSINIAILQSHTGQGLGAKLFAALEEWAAGHGIHRLDLTVMQNNQPAQKLYTRLGFATEGIKKASMKLDSEYIDEIYMYKWLP